VNLLVAYLCSESTTAPRRRHDLDWPSFPTPRKPAIIRS